MVLTPFMAGLSPAGFVPVFSGHAVQDQFEAGVEVPVPVRRPFVTSCLWVAADARVERASPKVVRARAYAFTQRQSVTGRLATDFGLDWSPVASPRGNRALGSPETTY